MKNKLVTVIIPVFKTEKYVESAIKSVLRQRYPHLEIILIDDGSPDRSPEICDLYASKHSNISVIHKLNGGLSDARNVGIKASNGEYILFLDSDDRLSENAIATLFEAIDKPPVGAVVPNRCYKFYENSNSFEETIDFHNCGTIESKKYVLDIMLHQGRAWRSTGVLYNGQIIRDKNLFFPVGYTAEDIVFNLRYMSMVEYIRIIPFSVLHNLKRRDSITNTFRPQLFHTYLFIDDQIQEYFNRNMIIDVVSTGKRNALFRRNVILQLTSLMDKCNGLYTIDRMRLVNEILIHDKTKIAFSDAFPNNVYFDDKMKILYIQAMEQLLRKNFKNSALLLATLAGSINSIKTKYLNNFKLSKKHEPPGHNAIIINNKDSF